MSVGRIVTLKYTNEFTPFPFPHTHTMDFPIYGYTPNVEIERKTHLGLNGQMVEYPIGANYNWRIDLQPIQPDSAEIDFLTQFCLYDQNLDVSTARAPRQVVFYDSGSPVTYDVALPKDSVPFSFEGNAFFAGIGSLDLVTTNIVTFSDNGDTWTLVPNYTGLNSITTTTHTNDTGNFSCVLVDVNSLKLSKHDLNFITGSFRDVPFGNRQAITINFEPITDGYFPSTLQTWLIQFCLRRNKKIDTSGIGLVTGSPYTVIHPEKKIDFRLASEKQNALETRLTFYDHVLTNKPLYF